MICEAKYDQASAIVDLLAGTVGGTQTEAQVGLWIADPGRIVLVDPEQRGVILGLCAGDEAEITDVAVAPSHQRKGLGAALVRAFIQTTQRDLKRSIFLEVRPSNVPAIALYTGQGFESVGRRSGYYSDGEDALILRWDAS